MKISLKWKPEVENNNLSTDCPLNWSVPSKQLNARKSDFQFIFSSHSVLLLDL